MNINVSYTPKACTDYVETVEIDGKEIEREVKATFSGSVVLRKPSFEERLELSANPDVVDMINNSDNQKEKKITPQQMKTIISMVKWSYKFFEKVDLKRLKDGVHFQNLDELRLDPTGGPILQDIAMKLSYGFEMGNS